MPAALKIIIPTKIYSGSSFIVLRGKLFVFSKSWSKNISYILTGKSTILDYFWTQVENQSHGSE